MTHYVSASPFPASVEPLSDVKRALVVCAHPDDIEHGAAGTIAQWVASGITVTYLLVTRGDAGGFDDGTPREEIPRIREDEQRRAAKEIGVTDVRFLDGYRDGLVEVTVELRRDISRVIRQVRPDRVLTSSPVRTWALKDADHPDHAAVGQATCRAIYPDSHNPFAFEELRRDEGLDRWVVREVWYSGGPAPDHFVDVTDTAQAKILTLRAYVSQPPGSELLAGEVLAELAETAATGGLSEGRYAEAFTVVRRR